MNGNRTAEVVRPGGGGDRTKPLFEGNLRRDGPNGPIWVHRIEVEVLAAKEGGTRSTIVNGKEGKESVDWEKCTVFVHLLK